MRLFYRTNSSEFFAKKKHRPGFMSTKKLINIIVFYEKRDILSNEYMSLSKK
ncbi:hypothetical protein LEP1GSC050_2964 [Leptospira broomii serovar Hurstbridge str. 5399]|uniref:Uncharacterized protein n=1 Tax=Leptospira broomii serovar Hurstbridge str. 5399 TaxID=1049789 RepID=T0FCT7_9LEPT|nr:hypothetical protein LEP1GSC050_2964 [Leptospira broomii serovar Hurstbridge str. 5399]